MFNYKKVKRLHDEKNKLQSELYVLCDMLHRYANITPGFRDEYPISKAYRTGCWGPVNYWTTLFRLKVEAFEKAAKDAKFVANIKNIVEQVLKNE